MRHLFDILKHCVFLSLTITQFFSFTDSLTLQLWKDRKDWEKHPPSKGSIALEGYLGKTIFSNIQLRFAKNKNF